MRVLTALLILLLLVNKTVADDKDDTPAKTEELKYVFFYSDLNFMAIAQTFNIPLTELLDRDRTIAAVIRGWKRGFAKSLDEQEDET